MSCNALLNAQMRPLVFADQIINNLEEVENSYNGAVDFFVIPVDTNPLLFIQSVLSQHESTGSITIHVMTKPGSIIFNNLSITVVNQSDYEAALISVASEMSKGGRIILKRGDEECECISADFASALESLSGLLITCE